MELLTGKAKEDFIKHCKQDANWLQTYEDIFLNALIIEWFDSVGIYINLGCISLNGKPQYDYCIQEDNTLNGMNGHVFNSRHEATIQAIKESNRIYNERLENN